jgi:SAM-dependent methyltransferase
MTGSPFSTPMPWDLLASAYEEEVLPSFRFFVEEALRRAAPPVGARLADIACGPGTLALLAAERGFEVDALDFSPEMVALLERAVRERGITRIRPRLGDGQALPYPDRGHDGAFSLFGLMFFPDRARGFSELRRILRPGARAVVSSWQPMEQSPTLVTLFAAMQQALPSGAAPPSPPPPLGTADACRAEMERAFGEVEVHPVSTRVSFPSAAALWASMERSMPPLVLTRHQLGEQVWAPISVRVRDTLAGSLGTGAVTLDLHAWLSVGRAA